ncbi:hypothetical protein [Nonomuraea sp. SYSU D8015]|uniref:hypothetical protein n=1 Tax=Nonomuraea sp. SYSU D8015 TaxID=2593644 RepID=UPI0016613063|nr:hypothetical protein [Nonomuraea sp. SYSU D8015]
MIKKLAGTVLVAAAATTLMAAPAAASSTSSASAESATTAARQLIRSKVSFGRCEDTCTIRVRVKNISGKRLFNVRLNARLSVNGRKVGTCTEYVGTIRPYGTRYTSCTVRTSSLSRAYNNYLDGLTGFRYYARTNVSYRYYR